MSAGAAGNTESVSNTALKWLPYQPAVRRTSEEQAITDSTSRAPKLIAASAGWANVASGEVSNPVRAPASNSMSDPFADGNRLSRPTTPDAVFRDELVEPPVGGGMKPSGSPPAMPTEEPTRQPYAPSMSETVPPARPETLLPIPQSSSTESPFHCPTPADKEFFKPINEVTIDIKAKAGDFPTSCYLSEKTLDPHQLRPWCPTTVCWTASALCRKPLYFEEVQLERYGHAVGPILQPIISGGHFFVTVPFLPYLMGVDPPAECQYTLGYYRPGSCAPWMIEPIPLSTRGALIEAGAITGAALLIP
jgi:hypothetical protein